ncbi:helix-turn-helix domain-containing protein [Piscinibacter sp. HJYY11]|uniref:helix-turn-helix domain-containing protein n=1 Tax=Piscinibacter sp. HJYY11 TaxID=2801333 RepID=UPI00191D9142|nr:XRE family transcriptional regulator [Piscinibacter sp. HJYY11]MBL0730911.1 helix-turn-helix transcriptional regulator [Piscinibacter sp. HJYY11]
MKESASDTRDTLDQRIARRVRELRAAQGLTLEQLAARSGVSRSMISVVERGESSPTAALLDKLSAGLGTSLNALFEAPRDEAPPSPVARRADQPEWQDPDSGYVRRALTPPGIAATLQLVEVNFPPGARVNYEVGVHRAGFQQQVWVMSGSVVVTVGGERHKLAAGDCLVHPIDQPISFHNPSRQAAHYLVAFSGPPTSRSM